MPKFRKRPVEVEAIHFNDLKAACHIWDWANGPVAISSHKSDDGELIPILEIETLEGTMVAALGDWVIKGVKGEFYPCKPDIFAATYDPVHASDCALHNAPALPVGPCDCGAAP